MNQQTAQGLASLGRGSDSMLVHMAPEEVAGLQALALKHGGTLTINPETGLAEAGFLKNILPMIAGFALNAFAPGVGTAVGGMFGLGSAAGTALTVGGIAGLSSGSLEKGLMAGLGAYGGAGLSEGLMGAGTGAISSGATVDAVPAVPQAPVFEAAVPTAASGASAIPAGYETFAAKPEVYGAFGEAPAAAINAAQAVPTVTQAPVLSPSAADLVNANAAQDLAEQNAVAKALANKTPIDKLSAGLTAAGNAPGAFLKNNMMPLGALGIAALAGMDDNKGTPGLSNPGMIRPYTYSRTKVPGAFDRTESGPMASRERQYFNDQYTALTPYKAPGPEYMAEGGPVEAMSDANAIGMNTGYPQADIRTGAYATPFQQPISRNVVTGAQDAAVNPYTGQAQFADGGSVGGYTFDPRTGLYIKPSGEGATSVSPFGSTSKISGQSGQSGQSGGDHLGQLSKEQESFFDTEGETARDARMGQVSNVLSQIASFAVPGMGILGFARDNFPEFMADMSARASGYNPAGRSYGGASKAEQAAMQAAMSSPNTGVGNPGEQGVGPGNQSGNTNTGGLGTGDGGMGSGGGRSAGDARGGFYNNGKFDQRPANMAQGGISNLGSYSDGGRLLRGPGDGVSDDIPAMIGQKQQARLADGEFVVPARIVSELGNGSTEAGARQLYAMMDRVQKARRKTVGKDKVATNSRAAKLLPA